MPDAQRGGGGEEQLQLHRQHDRHEQLEKLCCTKGAVVYGGIIGNLEMGGCFHVCSLKLKRTPSASEGAL